MQMPLILSLERVCRGGGINRTDRLILWQSIGYKVCVCVHIHRAAAGGAQEVMTHTCTHLCEYRILYIRTSYYFVIIDQNIGDKTLKLMTCFIRCIQRAY